MLRGQTSDVATHLHRSSNFNEARELYVDLEKVVTLGSCGEDPLFLWGSHAKSFNRGEDSFFFFFFSFLSREEDAIENLYLDRTY